MPSSFDDEIGPVEVVGENTRSSRREEATSTLIEATRRGRLRPPDPEEGGVAADRSGERMRRWQEWSAQGQHVVFIVVQVSVLLAGVVKLLEMMGSLGGTRG